MTDRRSINFRIDTLVSDASCNELVVLTAKVKYDNKFFCHFYLFHVAGSEDPV